MYQSVVQIVSTHTAMSDHVVVSEHCCGETGVSLLHFSPGGCELPGWFFKLFIIWFVAQKHSLLFLFDCAALKFFSL